ncbi:MAG: efflux RND transporter periplasmic adaptor subunit [Vicinamibacteria bacterium]|nr:efflux RND transporter periplasmic adaptor subunit [Vicinamibacteria bacterium]
MTDEINEKEAGQPEERAAPPENRRRRVLGNLGWALSGAVLALLIATTWWRTSGKPRMDGRASASDVKGGERKILFYRNPMNPAVTSPVAMKDEMGMDYLPVYAEEAPGGARKILFYRNPMNPTVTSPVAMKDEMGMDYVPVYEDSARGGATNNATVSIDPRMVQNMNVRFEKVERGDLTREVRTVGYLEYDQQKMMTVTTKYAGFVEKVYVNYVGEQVRKGQPLFEIYAPELVQTQQDLLSALAFSAKMASGADGGGGRPMADARDRADALVAAARARLGYWDISQEQIEQLEKSGKVVRTLTVTAPSAGVVMKRADGLEGMALKPGMDSFHIADLSSLWLSVEVFEDQLGWIKTGSLADIDLSYFPGETFTGRVRFVEPQVTEKTRTVPLRLEVKNPSGRLRSGMYATVRFHPVVARDAITVPSLAVLRTGQRNMVVVSLGEGRFAPREVVLGNEGDGKVQVLKGLEEGEEIVTSAQFLIDSESSLREAIQKMVAAATMK